MKLKDLITRHQPENEIERAAVETIADMCGTFAECTDCENRVASCQLLDNQYESEIEKANG